MEYRVHCTENAGDPIRVETLKPLHFDAIPVQEHNWLNESNVRCDSTRESGEHAGHDTRNDTTAIEESEERGDSHDGNTQANQDDDEVSV